MNLTMQCLVYERPGSARLARRPVPGPEQDEVLVRIAVTGICGTDRGILLGEFPALPGVVLGHEAAGVIAALGAATSGFAPGDRVVVNPTSYCTRCRACQRGRPEHCSEKEGRETGVDRDGTMAEYLAVHRRYVHRLPDGLPFLAAALIEPLACVLNNLRCAGAQPGDLVAVLGAGPIGTLAARVLAGRGTRVTLVERDAARARLAGEALTRAAVRVAAGLGGAAAADVIIDTTGVLAEPALDLVEPGGTVVVMGERQDAYARIGLRALACRGVALRGAGPYRPADFEEAIALAGTLGLEALVTHVLPLHRYADAFDLLGMHSGQPGYQAMKVLLSSDPELATR